MRAQEETFSRSAGLLQVVEVEKVGVQIDELKNKLSKIENVAANRALKETLHKVALLEEKKRVRAHWTWLSVFSVERTGCG